VGGIGYRGVHGIESTEIGFLPLEFVQANNVTNMLKGEGHIFIDKEKLFEWDPDVLFIDEGCFELNCRVSNYSDKYSQINPDN